MPYIIQIKGIGDKKWGNFPDAKYRTLLTAKQQLGKIKKQWKNKFRIVKKK